MIGGTTSLCIDDGFDCDPAKNKSHIGHEYLKRLQAGSLGYNLVVELVKQRRVAQCKKTVNQGAAKKINQWLRKKADRIFLSVAFNSVAKTLVSHDFEDFQKQKRKDIRKEVGVEVVEACECIDKVPPRSEPAT
jgi:hypothetical protein